jgi:hypothetical protein
VIHERHYTPAEANELLPAIVALIDGLRASRDRLTDADAHAALSEAAPANGGGQAGREVGEGFLEVRRALSELQALDLVLRDLDRGLIDFPAIIDGREAYLCWELGEDEVGYWHELEAGFAGRQRLD